MRAELRLNDRWLKVEAQVFHFLTHNVGPAKQNSVSDSLLLNGNRRADNCGLLPFAKYHPLGVATRLIDDEAHQLPAFAQPRLQLLAINIQINVTARVTCPHGSFGHGRRLPQ